MRSRLLNVSYPWRFWVVTRAQLKRRWRVGDLTIRRLERRGVLHGAMVFGEKRYRVEDVAGLEDQFSNRVAAG